jgi:hypothetical protein
MKRSLCVIKSVISEDNSPVVSLGKICLRSATDAGDVVAKPVLSSAASVDESKFSSFSPTLFSSRMDQTRGISDADADAFHSSSSRQFVNVRAAVNRLNFSVRFDESVAAAAGVTSDELSVISELKSIDVSAATYTSGMARHTVKELK